MGADGVFGAGSDRGAYLAYRVYVVNTDISKRVRASLGWFATLVENKYYVDEAYNMIIVQPLRDVSGWFAEHF